MLMVLCRDPKAEDIRLEFGLYTYNFVSLNIEWCPRSLTFEGEGFRLGAFYLCLLLKSIKDYPKAKVWIWGGYSLENFCRRTVNFWLGVSKRIFSMEYILVAPKSKIGIWLRRKSLGHIFKLGVSWWLEFVIKIQNIISNVDISNNSERFKKIEFPWVFLGEALNAQKIFGFHYKHVSLKAELIFWKFLILGKLGCGYNKWWLSGKNQLSLMRCNFLIFKLNHGLAYQVS